MKTTIIPALTPEMAIKLIVADHGQISQIVINTLDKIRRSAQSGEITFSPEEWEWFTAIEKAAKNGEFGTRSYWEIFLYLLADYPVVTMGCTAGVLGVAGWYLFKLKPFKNGVKRIMSWKKWWESKKDLDTKEKKKKSDTKEKPSTPEAPETKKPSKIENYHLLKEKINHVEKVLELHELNNKPLINKNKILAEISELTWAGLTDEKIVKILADNGIDKELFINVDTTINKIFDSFKDSGFFEVVDEKIQLKKGVQLNAKFEWFYTFLKKIGKAM